jgi:hypothetical protein
MNRVLKTFLLLQLLPLGMLVYTLFAFWLNCTYTNLPVSKGDVAISVTLMDLSPGVVYSSLNNGLEWVAFLFMVGLPGILIIWIMDRAERRQPRKGGFLE